MKTRTRREPHKKSDTERKAARRDLAPRHKRVLAGILASSTVMGAVAALLMLLPRLSVTVNEPVDPSNAMSAPFTITNSGFIPLWDVGAELVVRYISASAQGVTITSTAPNGTRFLRPDWLGHRLNMDDHFTLAPSDLVSRATEGDISIAVVYKPWILPFHCERTFRFISHRESNGYNYWFAVPPS